MEVNTSALLVMDMQMGIVPRLPDQGVAVLKKVADAINTAREKNVMVIFVRVGFRKGLPEIDAANKMFGAAKQQLMSGNNLEAYMNLHPTLDVQENDIIIDKKRVSAFSGNELNMILHAQQITQLVLTGVSTSGVVLSTLREAADKDYELIVLSDACADRDDEIHRFLTGKIFPKQADVMTVEEWSE